MAKTLHKSGKTKTAKKINNKLFYDVLIVFILVYALWATLIFTSQRNKINDLEAQVSDYRVEWDSLQNKLDTSTQSRIGFAGAVDEVGNAVGQTVVDFYTSVLNQQDSNQPCGTDVEYCDSYEPLLTENAISQLSNSTDGSVLTCGQGGLRAVYIEQPSVNGDTANISVKLLGLSGPFDQISTAQLSVVKSGESWRIDIFTCAN